MATGIDENDKAIGSNPVWQFLSIPLKTWQAAIYGAGVPLASSGRAGIEPIQFAGVKDISTAMNSAWLFI
jgi:hypothetical protein